MVWGRMRAMVERWNREQKRQCQHSWFPTGASSEAYKAQNSQPSRSLDPSFLHTEFLHGMDRPTKLTEPVPRVSVGGAGWLRNVAQVRRQDVRRAPVGKKDLSPASSLRGSVDEKFGYLGACAKIWATENHLDSQREK